MKSPPRTIELVVTGHGQSTLDATVDAVRRGRRVLVVLRSDDPQAARRFRRDLRRAANGTDSELAVITNAEVVCVDGIDRVESVVLRHARTGRVWTVNASAFLSFDGRDDPSGMCGYRLHSWYSSHVSETPIADWAGARSEKWRRQLAGLEAMLRPIDDPLIQALNLTGPCRIADVGCGGGATTLEVRRRAPAGSVAHGFDLSPTLIEVARGRVDSTDAAVAFDVADMGSAAPPGQPYDRLISRFGIMFFGDPPAAFANLHRWLVSGGRFAFAVWAPLADNVWMTVIREVVSEIIELAPINPSAPGPFRYGDVSTLLSVLQGAGFVECAVTDWRGMLPIGGNLAAADAAQFALASFSSFAELLSDAGGDALGNARRALTERFAAYELNGAVTMHARVHIVTGTAL